jgi:hypothetical protein
MYRTQNISQSEPYFEFDESESARYFVVIFYNAQGNTPNIAIAELGAFHRPTD